MSEDEELISVRKFAGLLGVNQTTVIRAIDRGRIPVKIVDGTRKIPKVQGLKDWETNKDVSQDRSESGKSSAKFAEVRIAKVEIESEFKRLKVDEMNRRLISREEVEEEISKANALVRERILSIGARCAAEWAGITDPVELQNLIEEELQQALEHLCNADFGSS